MCFFPAAILNNSSINYYVAHYALATSSFFRAATAAAADSMQPSKLLPAEAKAPQETRRQRRTPGARQALQRKRRHQCKALSPAKTLQRCVFTSTVLFFTAAT